MGLDPRSSSPPPAASASPPPAASAAKRGRDPEDEVYVDNLHSHKRYLSEIMASSLNGLTVGDSVSDRDHLMESPFRSEGVGNSRDEITSQYSPMSEDSDDGRFYDTPLNMLSVPYDCISRPTSPVSPHRHQKSTNVLSSVNSYPLPGSNLPAVACSHVRHRGSDSEGRYPSSPNDVCHTPDLRRAALLRSVQMRSQPCCPPTCELPLQIRQESMENVEEEDPPYSCIKTLDEETSYANLQAAAGFTDTCSSVSDILEAKDEETAVMVPKLQHNRGRK